MRPTTRGRPFSASATTSRDLAHRLVWNAVARADGKTMNEHQLTALTPTLCCQECRRAWRDAREHWRLYLSNDDTLEPLLYCPDCARREFEG